MTLEWGASFIWYKNPSFTQLFRHISIFLTFLMRAASRRLVHDELATNPHNLSAEKREINSLRSESRLVWYRKTGSFFFQSFVDGARKGRMLCISPRALHAWTFTGIIQLLLPPSIHREEKKKRDSGNMRKEGRATTGGRAGVGGTETGSTKRTRERTAPKPYTRRSKESSVLSATMVTKRTGRSLSQTSPLRSMSRSSSIRLSSAWPFIRLSSVSLNRV